MSIPVPNPNTLGNFVPTTFAVDAARIVAINVNSDEFKQLLIKLYQALNRMALALNDKTYGMRALTQVVTGNQYFPTQVSTSLVNYPYRFSNSIAINFGALPNNTTKSVPHRIDFNTAVSFVAHRGWATDQSGKTAVPIPYASATAANIIEINVDATNVNITTNSDRTNYTVCIIELEFLTQN